MSKGHPKNVPGVKPVFFVQGGGKDVHDAWDNKLVAALERALGPGYLVHYPRLPVEDDPHAGPWKAAIDHELRKLSGPVLVAHSIGAAILLDYLADREPSRRFAGVFLIAPPFIGDGGWPSDELRPTKALVGNLPDDLPLYIYQGSDDQTVPPSHGDLFEKAFRQATVRRLRGRDHQLGNDLSEIARDITRLE